MEFWNSSSKGIKKESVTNNAAGRAGAVLEWLCRQFPFGIVHFPIWNNPGSAQSKSDRGWQELVPGGRAGGAGLVMGFGDPKGDSMISMSILNFLRMQGLR